MSSAAGDASLARGFYNCPETPSPVSLRVAGQLPKWLNGVLHRTGPGTFSIPTRTEDVVEGEKNHDGTFEIRHWFDGLALHHRFEIQNGQVLYRSKKGATAVEDYIKRKGVYPPGGSFGQADPCESLLGKLFTKFTQSTPEKVPKGPQAFNISVTLTPSYPGFGGHLVSKTDANILQVIDRVTLEPIAVKSYRSVLPQLDGPLASAHAGVEDGEYYNYTLSLGMNPVYKVFKIDAQGKGTVLAEINAPAAYIHTVFLTKRYFVLAIWQCDFKLGGLPMMVHGSMSVNTFKPWSNTRKTLFFVVDRQNGGVVGRYQTDAFFAFHCINSYDDDDDSIVLDIACYEDNSIIELNTLENLRNLSLKPSKPYSLAVTARRFRLQKPTSTSPTGLFLDAKVEFDLGLPANIELPTVSPHVANRPYRYAYGIHTHRDNEQTLSTALSNSIIKLDMHTGDKRVWRDQNSEHVPGEPIFVPRPAEEDAELAEDAGVLLTVSLDARKGSSALVVIDAQTMEEVARAEMSIPFPFSFHGAFSKL